MSRIVLYAALAATALVAACGGGAPDAGGPEAALQMVPNAAPAAARAPRSSPPPVIREYAVNTSTVGYQGNPAAARLANGGHVIAWKTYFDGGDTNVCSRQYGADGSPTSTELCVQAADAGYWGPVVAALRGGGYVLAWSAVNETVNEIRAQVVSPSGHAAGPVQAVSTGPDRFISDLSMAGAGGGFVIAWRSQDHATATVSVLMRRFARDGTPIGNERTVVAAGWLLADMPPYAPTAIALPHNSYAIAWARYTISGAISIHLQRFNPAGVPHGSPTLLMQDHGSTNLQAVGDRLVAAWVDREGFVHLQRVSLDGQLIGAELTPYPEERPPPNCVRYLPRPNACTVIQKFPTVAALDDDGFVVAWESETVPYVSSSLWARRFAANGSPHGPATSLQVDRMSQHAVAGRADGGFVVAWRADNNSTPGDWADIFARQYSVTGLLAEP